MHAPIEVFVRVGSIYAFYCLETQKCLNQLNFAKSQRTDWCIPYGDDKIMFIPLVFMLPELTNRCLRQRAILDRLTLA